MPEILLIAINKLGVNLIDTRSKVRQGKKKQTLIEIVFVTTEFVFPDNNLKEYHMSSAFWQPRVKNWCSRVSNPPPSPAHRS